MRIDSSSIGMESARRFSSVTRKTAYTYRGRAGSMRERNGLQGGFLSMGEEAEKGKESQNTKSTLPDIALHFQNMSNTSRVSVNNREQNARESIRQSCMQFLMYLLFGDSHKRELDEVWGNTSLTAGSYTNQEYTTVQSYYHSETETTSFATQGMVKTADGREINFNLELQMSRSFAQFYEEEYHYKVPETTDPLVINLDTDIAELSDQKFFFDLDCDGKKEEISMLKSGSGYLALDKNKDGIINDGSELFGAESGNGFADLAKYDLDKNGWIDENDAIWKELLIWTKDENGKDKKYHLSEAGIGAICLQNAQTEYALNAQKDNQNKGYIRKTGIFLYENGSVGTLQHLDLAHLDLAQ